MLTYTKNQLTYLVILRMLIGWHFLYEGIVKMWNPQWSAKGYLLSSEWIFGWLFQSMAANDSILSIINFLNIWGLTLIGLFLILGFSVRIASIAGVVLLGFYYLAHPPLIGMSGALPTEGSYLIVNKTLIELFALLVISVFPTSQLIGIDLIIKKFQKQPATE